MYRTPPSQYRLRLHPAILVCLCRGLLAVLPVALHAQVNPRTEIAYLFDDHTFREAHDQTFARPVGVELVADRFGNDRSAVGLNGNINSYLNLGVSPLLRPRNGTVSLWVNVPLRLYSGKGAIGQPVLMMKGHTGDDWYDALTIYFLGDSRSFAVVSTQDSLNEAMLHSVNPIRYGKWYHLAVTISDSSLALYIDGNLHGKCPKDFPTRFLETDSLMIGHTANKKNVRFLMGAIDDVRIYHRVLNAQEIRALYEAPNPNRLAVLLQQVLFWSAVAGGVFVVSFLLVWQRRRRFKRAGERLDFQRQLHEMEIRTLKAQMNPHFIFNALNSIQVFIMSNDNARAETYLAKFSKLLRELLESNTRESLSVAEERTILENYLEIESLRFGGSFSYAIHVDERIDGAQTRIPHMLIQPFVENAIWHGLLPREGDRRLDLLLEYDTDRTVRCIIDDNGVGRAANRSKEQTFKKTSLALSIVRQRLALMNTLLHADCGVEIADKISGNGAAAGTRVTVTIPVLTIN